MAIIDKLQQRPTFNPTQVKEAMEEARHDPVARQQLQTLVETRPKSFEDSNQVDQVLQLLTKLNKDCFEIVPNRQTGTLGVPEALEARITKVKDEKRRVDLTPPPPPPPVYRRDPLNVTGKAPAGSAVEFYNASLPGRPVLGSVIADGHGAFSYELTDETKFAFGDQIGVRLVGHDGTKGRALIVPTEPFLITNTETTYFTRQAGDLRTDHTSSQVALDKKTDDRPPFFQSALVDTSLTVPGVIEQPYTFTLIGRDDAVEPNSTIRVKVGQQEYQTTVDDLGQFALKVKDVIPGQRLKIEVRDINGHGVDIPARVPPIAFPVPRIVAALHPQADGVRVKIADAVPPGGALIVRNTRSGVVSELNADDKGRLDGLLKGIEPFDAFEVAVRDVNGHVSEQTELMVHLPEGVVLAHSLDTKEPDLAAHLQSMCGPPVDVIVHGQKKPGGPFLPLPALPQVPAHAVLEVLKDGVLVQALRADGGGRLEGMLRGVHVGDALSFRLKDAGGRLFPTQILGFVVPDGHVTSKVSTHVPPALAPLDPSRIGSGTLTLDPAWLAPANVLVGALAPTDFQLRHAVASQVGGALLAAPEKHFMAEHFPDHKLDNGASVVVSQAQGRKTLSVTVAGTAPWSFGFDDTLGTLQPSIAVTDLPRLQAALQATLAVVGAAYAQGMEPGDVGYDRALGAAKTLLFLLDRFALQHPGEAAAARQVASDALHNKPFPFEISPRDVVGAGRQEPIEATSSSSLNLLQARTFALGAIGRGAMLVGQSRGLVDVAALSQQLTFDGSTIAIAAKGVVAAGDQLLVKVLDAVHVFSADNHGVVSGSIDHVAPGTVLEIAQRDAKESERDARKLNPITKAVVVSKPILGEGQLVALDALVHRAPDARAVAEAVIKGGAVAGLPPGGSVSVVKDAKEFSRIAIDEHGALTNFGIKGNAGDLLDVHVLDAAGRPFAPMVAQLVLGQDNSGHVKLNVDALSLAAVLAEVGNGSLALPTFPKEGRYEEAYAELNPMWGPSSSLEDDGNGRFRTKAAFAPGLLPALAKGPDNARLGMGNSITLGALQRQGGETILNASFYIENQRPDFKLRYDDRTGVVTDGWTNKAIAIPGDLNKLTTLLQTSIAFMATAQKLGSEPGDGMYDLAARTAKSTLVIFDHLVRQNPTFKTEIMAAMRAAVPTSMPFDLAPVGNAPRATQTPPTDRQSSQMLNFWNAVLHEDSIKGVQQNTWRPRAFDVPVSAGVAPSFFGAPRTIATGSTLPMYLRGR